MNGSRAGNPFAGRFASRLALSRLAIRLLVAFVLVAAVPVGGVGVFLYQRGEAMLRQHQLNELNSIVELKSQRLDGWLEERRRDVMRPASIAHVRRLAATLVTGPDRSKREAAYRELQEILHRVATSGEFAEMFLLRESDARVVLSTEPEQEGKFKADRPYFQEGRKGPFLQHVYYSLTLGKAVMTLSAPVTDRDGRPVAILVGRLDLRFLDRVMAERVGLGRTGRTFLVNRFNYFVSESLGRGVHGFRPVFTDGVKRALGGQSGTAVYINHDQLPVVAAYRWLPDLALALVGEVDEAEAFAPIRALWVALLVALGLGSAVALVLGLGIAYWISGPVVRLVDAVRAIGAGDLMRRVNVTRPSELAALAAAVNGMAEDLSSSRQQLEAYGRTLEQRVEERTAESETRRRRAEALAEIAHVLAQSLEPEVVAQRVVESIMTLFGGTAATLYRLEPESGDLVSLAAAGNLGPTSDLNVRLPRHTGVVGVAVRERQPVVTTDLLADPRIAFATEARGRIEQAPFRAVLAVPLLVQGRVIGALGIGDGAGRVFDREQIELAQAFASQAALALENARLYDEARERSDRMKQLIEMSRLVTASLDPQRVLEGVTGAALDFAEGDLARLWVADDAAGVLRLAASKARGEEPAPPTSTEFPLGRGLVGWVMAQRTTHYSPNLADDPLQVNKAWVIAGGYVSQLAVPLVIGDRALGVLVVLTRRLRQFSREEQGLLELFAASAAIALENARLYQHVQQAYEELSRTQHQLTQAQKMEAIGRLAGGIAHDFNNLLTVITGRSLILLERLPADDPTRRPVELIAKTAERAAALTKQVLAFSRKQVLAPKVLDLNEVVGGIAAMLRRLIGEDIEFVFHPGSGLGRVHADPSQIEQIVVNLVVNARDAMPAGGQLTIETANVELDEPYARQHVGVSPGSYVMLAVSDTGIGMDAETRARLFEPFFTTKEPGKGTGLGLATVYGIVKQSGGHIFVYSEPGKGATFKIYLPRTERIAEPAAAKAAAPGPGTETVLLVEDEEEVRGLAHEILEHDGYTVLVARQPDEALSIAEQHPGPIHLLLTDVVMPRMSGRALAERLASGRPETKVVYMSGYADDAVVRHGTLDPKASFLQKPFTPTALARRVREVLDSAGRSASAGDDGERRVGP